MKIISVDASVVRKSAQKYSIYLVHFDLLVNFNDLNWCNMRYIGANALVA